MPKKDLNGETKFGRQTTLISLIKESGEAGCAKKDLSDLWVSRQTLDRDLKDLIDKGAIKRHPKKYSAHNAVYIYVDRAAELSKPEKPQKEDMKLKKGQNFEGYPDPTASSVINEIDTPDILPGEIWSHRTNSGETHDFLVLMADKLFVTGFRLHESYVNPLAIEPATVTTTNYKTYIFDVGRIATCPVKYFLPTGQSIREDDLDEVKSKFIRRLGIQPEKIEVIKEKIVEKPVEIAADESLKAENDILRAKIEVYKEAFAAFGNGGNGR